MKTITKLKILAISTMVVFSACQKEQVSPEISTFESLSTINSEKGRIANGWKKIEGLPQGTIFNLSYENGELLALGNSERFQINPSTLKVKAENFGSFSEDYSTTINQGFFTKMRKSSIFVFNTENPQNFATLDLNKLDPQFNKFISLPGYYSKAIASSKNNVFLTAYVRNSSIERANETSVLLVVFSTSISKSGNVVISDVKTIPVKGISTGARLLTVFAWEEKFIVSFDSLSMVVCHDGFYNVVSDQSIFEVVPFNGVLVGFGNDQMLVSRDGGITWNTLLRNKPGNFNYWMQKGIQFGNEIITSSPTAIYQIDLKIENSEFYVSQIATDELGLNKEHLIYDLARVNNMLYVATSRGIYYRPIESKNARLVN
jgi:hypothetical protein